MKKLALVVLFAAALFAGCKKAEMAAPAADQAAPVAETPAAPAAEQAK